MKIYCGDVVITVESKDDLLVALQAIDELRLDASTSRTPESGENEQPLVDYRGMTIIECAREILLANNNRPMHHGEISTVAIGGGYRSGRTTSNPAQTTRRSFEQTIRRSDQFKPVGKGRFQLRHAENVDQM